MLTTRVTLDVKAFTKDLNALAQRQLPFATSLAINRLGEAFQKAERERLGSIFTLRRKDFIEKQGVKRIGGIATKQNPSVTYGIDPKASFLEKFESDRTKRPLAGAGHSLAIPVQAKRNKTDIVTAGNRPRALIARLKGKTGAGSVFVVPVKKGRIGPGIFQRTGRNGRGGLKLLFAFEPQVQITPSLAFVDTAKRVATEQWPSIFESALQQAIRTAR